MSLATKVAELTTTVNNFMDLVKGQYNKWDGQVKAKIAELQSWKEGINIVNSDGVLYDVAGFPFDRNLVVSGVESGDEGSIDFSSFSYTTKILISIGRDSWNAGFKEYLFLKVHPSSTSSLYLLHNVGQDSITLEWDNDAQTLKWVCTESNHWTIKINVQKIK